MYKTLIISGVLLGGLAIGSYFWETEAPSSSQALSLNQEDETPPFPVETVRITRRTLTETVWASGRLLAGREAELSPGVGGQIAHVAVREGDRVAAGDLLVQLDDRAYRLALNEARHRLLEAQVKYAQMIRDATALPPPDTTQLQAARETWQAAQQAFAQGALDATSFEAARRNREITELFSGARRTELIAQTSGLTQAEAAVARAELDVEQAAVHAPFAGSVARRLVEQGQQVGPGQVCLTVVDLSLIRVQVAVLESQLRQAAVGRRARVRISTWPDETFTGRVSRLYPVVDPDAGVGYVEVKLRNADGRLKPGMYAEVLLDGMSYADRLAAPKDAIVVRDGRPLVFRVEGGRALWTYVETGIETDGWTEILNGVSEGDTVVVTGNFTLAHDVRVAPRMMKD